MGRLHEMRWREDSDPRGSDGRFSVAFQGVLRLSSRVLGGILGGNGMEMAFSCADPAPGQRPGQAVPRLQ